MQIAKWTKMFYFLPTIYWLKSDNEVGITWLMWSIAYVWSNKTERIEQDES